MSRRPPAGSPAILGGEVAFPEGLPLVRPWVPELDRLEPDLRRILESRHLTNGRYVRELERRAGEYVGVASCVAVASCTAGLMLALGDLERPGEVILPSFTFVASAHAVAWNGLTPVFADVDRATLTLSPEAVGAAVTARTRAVLATHVYGTPCDVEGLEAVAAEADVPLFFDAAHAFGSFHRGTPVGRSGRAEVFSMTPTKLLVAGEGGLVATGDARLAERCRVGREYGNPGDYDTRFVGLNARMSEFHAALALASLDTLDERVARRNTLAEHYRAALGEIPGLAFPSVPEGDRSTRKDFSVLVEEEAFGLEARCLARALAAEGVETRRYYAPPVHRQQAYRQDVVLPVTEWAAARVLTLPLWEEMTEDHVSRVADAVLRIHATPGVVERCTDRAGTG